MANETKDGLKRRDFMMAAIALVGAPTVLVNNAGAADSQRTKAPDTPQGTIYTGDVIQGKKVISALDVNDLESGQKHAFYFQGVQMPTGQHWYVSVIAAVGAKPGKRVLLTSGVHGDEMSPVHMIQTVMSQLDPAQMSGTVLAVPDVSRPALESMARRWPNSGRGIDLIDINREWPQCAQPPRRAPVQQALETERRLRARFPYRGYGNGCNSVQSCPDGAARGPGDGGALSHRPDLRQPRLSHSARERIHQCRYPGTHARDWRFTHPGPRHDPFVRGRHNECAQAPRDDRRYDGPHREGHEHLHRQQRAHCPCNPWRIR